MKIKKANAGPLTNFEVLDFLRSRGASTDNNTRVMSPVLDSEFKVFDYLVKGPACNQTRESINEFVEKSKEYQLAKAEIMSIINIRPTSAVELATMIEEWDKRMEDRIEELAEMIDQVLPPLPNSDQEAAADDSAEGAQEE